MSFPPASLEALASFTTLSKTLAGGLIVGFFAQLAVPPVKQYLALVPGRTLPFVFQVVTSGLLEDSFISAIGYAVAVLFLLRIVEPVYGPREVLRFLLAVLAATGVTTFLLAFVLFLVSSDKAHGGSILYTEICGFHGAFAALLVAIKQIIPENEVALFGGLVRFRAKHLPGLFVALVVVLGAVAGQPLKLIPFAVCGAFYGWIYLRFLQSRGEGVRGDPNPDFRFATFFPEAAQPLVDQAVAPCAGLFKLGASSAQQGGGAQQGRGYVLGGAAPEAAPDSWDAARRRERGARALEERLGLKSAAGGAQANAAAAGDVEAPAPPAEQQQ